MKISVIINNYNYSRFIIDCIDSVLNQTYKNIEVLIIDDGSTDNSVKLVNNKYEHNPFVKIIVKENGGQLSAFNESVNYVSGAIVFFLDSDDIYKENYIETIVNIYKNNETIDFVFSAVENFFVDGRKEIVQKYKIDTNIGFSVLSSLYTKEWIGSVTSGISMKRDLLNKILPIPLEKDWKTRADDCLVWGSSILCANKYYCSKPLVSYRIHKDNNFFNKKNNVNYLYMRGIAINRLFNHFFCKLETNHNLISLIELEFNSRTHKNFNLLVLYIKILFISKEKFLVIFKKASSLVRIYIKSKISIKGCVY